MHTYFPLNLTNRKLVFFDWWNVEAGYTIRDPVRVPNGIKLEYPIPEISEPILKADQEWEKDFIGLYTSLLFDGEKYRLYYEGYPDYDTLRDASSLLCVAYSKDGVCWEKPDLGLIEFKGNPHNNILMTPALHPRKLGIHGETIFIDPHGVASERFKMTYCSQADDNQWVVFGATSADGLRWHFIPEPLVHEHADSQTIITWNPEKQKYIGYFRHWEANRRHITYAENPTFTGWPTPTFLLGAEPNLPPSTDYYTNSYTPWPGVDGTHLMFPSMYHRATDRLEVWLGVSRNGKNWSWPLDRAWVPTNSAVPNMAGMVLAGSGLVELPNKRWAISLGCNPRTHNELRAEGIALGELRLAILRPDGFSALSAEHEGEFFTVPLTFKGKTLQINATTGSGGWIRVELFDALLKQPLPGFTLDSSLPLKGDLLWAPVSWAGAGTDADGENLSDFDDCTIEIHVKMKSAKIFGFQFI